jgi:hypothetical protein
MQAASPAYQKTVRHVIRMGSVVLVLIVWCSLKMGVNHAPFRIVFNAKHRLFVLTVSKDFNGTIINLFVSVLIKQSLGGSGR